MRFIYHIIETMGSLLAEAYRTLAAFAEMFDVVEYIGYIINRNTYTCHSLKDESKAPNLLTEWTTEWLETRINETETHETPSLCSSEFNVHQDISTAEKPNEDTSEENVTTEKAIKSNVETIVGTIEKSVENSDSVVNENPTDEKSSKGKVSIVSVNSISSQPFENDITTIVEYSKDENSTKIDDSSVENGSTTENSIEVDISSSSENITVEILVEKNTSANNNDSVSNSSENVGDSKFESGEITSNITIECKTTTDAEFKLQTENFNGSSVPNQSLTEAEALKDVNVKLGKQADTLNQTECLEQIVKIRQTLELLNHEEKWNNFEECTEAAKQILAVKNNGDLSKTKEIKISEPVPEVSKRQSELFQKCLNSLNRCDSTDVDIETPSTFVNKVEVQLNSQPSPKSTKTIEDLKTKKFITSSWDLVSIVKLLYKITEPKAPQVCQQEHALQARVYILSQGAFYEQSEGYYDVLLQNLTFNVLEDENILFSFPLDHAEMYIENGNTLILDNNMGRCLHLKCETLEDLPLLQMEFEMHRDQCWATECINLVHYPLKCHQNIVIIDLGSCSTRAGVLMDQPTLPTLFFPSVCATNKTSGKHLYGIDALQTEARKNSTVSFPLRPSATIIKHSIDIEHATGIFKKIFQDLKIETAKYTVLVCLPRSLSTSVQNEMVKVLLEDLNVKAVSLAQQAILTMYAHNVSTGVVVDIGDRLDILPVIDGFVVDSGVTRLPYGGQRLIHHMKHALAQKHISLSNDIDSFVVQYITENLAYIAEDYEKEDKMASIHPQRVRKSVDLQNFALDVNCLQSAVLDEARFKVPEGLFDPERWGLDCPGVHKLVQKAIQAASVDARKKVAENIYLSGGVTMIPGFVQRMRREVTKMNQPRIVPKVYASHYRYHCTYIGACRFARMDAFSQVCVTKAEFAKNQAACLKKFMLCL